MQGLLEHHAQSYPPKKLIISVVKPYYTVLYIFSTVGKNTRETASEVNMSTECNGVGKRLIKASERKHFSFPDPQTTWASTLALMSTSLTILYACFMITERHGKKRDM